MTAKKTAKKAKTVTKNKFDKLTPAQKRVMISKDVLKQIEARKYLATTGTYMEFGKDRLDIEFEAAKMAGIPYDYDQAGYSYWAIQRTANETDGQALVKAQSKCYVCGIGAGICSAVNLFDDCTAGEMDTLHSWLEKYFDREQQRMIEGTFEQAHCYGNVINEKIAKLKTPTARLKAIFRNIVKNKGEFVIE